MKKNYLLAVALAIMTMASCSDNDFVGDQGTLNSSGDGAITFGFDVPAVTRAGGATAATALGNHFIVYGEKSETTDGAAPVTDGSTTHQLVFRNYVVKYTGNSAYSTTSNTKGWEYVGLYKHTEPMLRLRLRRHKPSNIGTIVLQTMSSPQFLLWRVK